MASINRTSHHHREDGSIRNRTTIEHKNTSPQEVVLPLVLFILIPRGNPPPHTGVGYYTTMVARTSINLVSLMLLVVSSLDHARRLD